MPATQSGLTSPPLIRLVQEDKMNTYLGNIGTIERIMRLALGTLLLGMVFRPELPPQWFALVAPYPIITAIIAWDPFYALFEELKHKLLKSAPLSKQAHA